MKTIGFAISHKENEHRRALIPEHLRSVKHPEMVYVEQGYGVVLGYTDNEYLDMGAKIVSHDEILKKDIICDPKIGDADYLNHLDGQTIFGWVHAVQNRDITDILVNNHLTAYAWEDMYDRGRHCFWRNNEIAGEAAVIHAFMLHGLFPYDAKVAVIGRGNVARGVVKTLNYFGAQITTYDRRTERLFRDEIGDYDVVVNAILWDTSRHDHIIYRDDLLRMKPGAMIIDVSCDRNGGVETSIPTTIEHPDYLVNGIRHYVVDHTPSLFYKTTSLSLSLETVRYLDYLVAGYPKDNTILSKALIVERGKILDQRILDFQHRTQ